MLEFDDERQKNLFLVLCVGLGTLLYIPPLFHCSLARPGQQVCQGRLLVAETAECG